MGDVVGHLLFELAIAALLDDNLLLRLLGFGGEGAQPAGLTVAGDLAEQPRGCHDAQSNEEYGFGGGHD